MWWISSVRSLRAGSAGRAFGRTSAAMSERVPGYAGQSGEDRAPGRYGAQVSSMCMPSQPQRWNEWSDRLAREARGNARWRQKWPGYRPEDVADLPWSTALRRNRALTSPRGLGASANWSLPDATALRSTITGLPVLPPFTPEPAATLPSLMQSTIRENAMLSKPLRRHTRRSNFAMKSMNSLSYDMVWEEQLVRSLPSTRGKACTLDPHAHAFSVFSLCLDAVSATFCMPTGRGSGNTQRAGRVCWAARRLESVDRVIR